MISFLRLLQGLTDRTNRMVVRLQIHLESMRSSNHNVSIQWPRKISWPPGWKWTQNLLAGLKVLSSLSFADIPQPKGSVIRFIFNANNTDYVMALDYSDYRPIDRDLAAQSTLYFKMQYDRNGYGLDNVIPGGFPPNDLLLYAHLKDLRKKRHELGCQFDVYGRFGKGFAFETRERCINSLRNHSNWNFRGGFEFVRYTASLMEAAHSKICIDLPGNGDFCFRLVDYMALGTCIIAHPHSNRFPCELEDRKHLVYMKEDMSDLIELIEYYLEHETEAQEIGKNAALYFDNHLSYNALASYYIQEMINRTRSIPSPSANNISPNIIS